MVSDAGLDTLDRQPAHRVVPHGGEAAGRGLDPDHVAFVNRVATGGLRPHLTLVLDIPPEVGRQRQADGGILAATGLMILGRWGFPIDGGRWREAARC